MADGFNNGIAIERISFKDFGDLNMEAGKETHRHDGHSFFLLESGTVTLEIDFQTYKIKPSSVIYVHPDQVHRTLTSKNVTVSSWTINNENLNPAYLELLEGIMPAKPLLLQTDIFSIMSQAVSLTIKMSERKQEKLYHSVLKDSCNALVAMVVSQYLERSASSNKLSRTDLVTKAFKELLERNYRVIKSPAEFAKRLHLSAPYLNECVKTATGFTVSHHIQHRVILEAKRHLFHSDRSIKEIAAELGFDDYPYFSRLFSKIAGITPAAFRSKNLD